MILVAGLNLSLDVVRQSATPTEEFGVAETEFPAGKAVNVARGLARLGLAVTLVAPVGQDEAPRFRRVLEQNGVTPRLHEVETATRRNIKHIAMSTGKETQSNQPGALLSPADLARVEEDLLAALPSAHFLVVTGSVPLGVPDEIHARWIGLARTAGVRTALDTSGERLALAIAERPWLIKINRAELAEYDQAATGGESAVIEVMKRLAQDGIELIAVTDATGALLVARNEVYRATVPPVEVINPVGAGDAFLAGLLAAATRQAEPAELLCEAAACAHAAVQSLDPGSFDVADYRTALPKISLVAKQKSQQFPAKRPILNGGAFEIE